MRYTAEIKDNHITSEIKLADGVYDVEIKKRGASKTYEQVKKLWATIDDISRAEYGDVSQSTNIYLQILNMAGVRTDKVLIPEEAVKDLKKKTKALAVISRETINHKPYAVVNVCFAGISEMTKGEVANVIESAIRWATELGIESELRNESYR